MGLEYHSAGRLGLEDLWIAAFAGMTVVMQR